MQADVTHEAQPRVDPSEGKAGPEPVLPLDDPRAVRILASEHGNLASARSLADIEALRAGVPEVVGYLVGRDTLVPRTIHAACD